MANKQEKELQKRKNQDTVIYRAIIDILLAVAALVLLRFINNNYSKPINQDSWREAFRWIAFGGAAITAAGVVLLFLKKAPRVASWLLCVGAVIAAVALLLFRFWYTPIPWLTYLTIAGGSLYLVWLLYPHDFFLIALLTTLVGTSFYLHGKFGPGNTVIALYVISSVLLVLSFLMTRKAAQHSGVFRFKALRFRLFASKGTPLPVYLCCAIGAACVVASLLLGSTFAYYCVYVAAGALFIAACYYTIKLD